MTLLTTEHVAEANNCTTRHARNWAKNNGVKLIGGIYLWSMEEAGLFEDRRGRGWVKGRARKVAQSLP